MTSEEAIRVLEAMRGELDECKAVDWKRSWRASEKAMTKAALTKRENAICVALAALREKVNNK